MPTIPVSINVRGVHGAPLCSTTNRPRLAHWAHVLGATSVTTASVLHGHFLPVCALACNAGQRWEESVHCACWTAIGDLCGKMPGRRCVAVRICTSAVYAT